MDKALTDLTSDIARVRKREEARLIKLAQKAGYFQRRMLTSDVEHMFATACAQAGPRQSQLRALEQTLTQKKAKQSADDRKRDANQKILLGAFLIAQMAHRPQDFDWVSTELEQFLDQHKDPKVAQLNKTTLAKWLGTSQETTNEH